MARWVIDPAVPLAPERLQIVVNDAAWAALVRPWHGMSVGVGLGDDHWGRALIHWAQPDCVTLDLWILDEPPDAPIDVDAMLDQVRATLATFPPEWQRAKEQTP